MRNSPTFPTPQRTAWSVEDRPATVAGCYPGPRITVDPQNTVFWRGVETSVTGDPQKTTFWRGGETSVTGDPQKKTTFWRGGEANSRRLRRLVWTCDCVFAWTCDCVCQSSTDAVHQHGEHSFH
ncbi:unnamed protein product [Arctogadus glacialis]